MNEGVRKRKRGVERRKGKSEGEWVKGKKG